MAGSPHHGRRRRHPGRERTLRNIACPAEGERTALVIRPDLFGRHKIYYRPPSAPSAFLLSLSGEDIAYPIPEYGAAPAGNGKGPAFPGHPAQVRRPHRAIAPAGWSGHAPASGGLGSGISGSCRRARPKPPPSKRRPRVRPRKRPAVRGSMSKPSRAGSSMPRSRPCGGYLRARCASTRPGGLTDAYVHVLRIGVRSWYHSDIIERDAFGARRRSCWPRPGGHHGPSESRCRRTRSRSAGSTPAAGLSG